MVTHVCRSIPAFVAKRPCPCANSPLFVSQKCSEIVDKKSAILGGMHNGAFSREFATQGFVMPTQPSTGA